MPGLPIPLLQESATHQTPGDELPFPVSTTGGGLLLKGQRPSYTPIPAVSAKSRLMMVMSLDGTYRIVDEDEDDMILKLLFS